MTAHANTITTQAVRSLDTHKARELRVIDVEGVTSICDCFIIAHGGSSTQVRALADYVEEELKDKHGIAPLRVEGYQSSNWILVDYGEVIVHVFNEEMRAFYDLERLWKDGQELDYTQFLDNEGDNHAV